MGEAALGNEELVGRVTRGGEAMNSDISFKHHCTILSDPSPEMLTTAVKIADLSFYRLYTRRTSMAGFHKYFICASILYTAHEKTNFPGYIKGQARAYKTLHRQQNE